MSARHNKPPARRRARARAKGPAVDHPQPLGDLSEIFLRRNIAVGIDGRGRPFLARPDSVRVDTMGDPDRIALVADRLERLDPGGDQARRVREIPPETAGVITVPVPLPQRRSCDSDQRLSLAPTQELVEAFVVEDKLEAEYNHVLFGSQVFIGHPFGTGAEWVGGLAFPRTTTDQTASGLKALLSTAQPAVAPKHLRRALDLVGRERPSVLILDTGLATEEVGGEVRPAHPELQSCRIHLPWLDEAAIDAHDDEDEPDDDHLGTLDFEAGHGTFISGIVRQICPDADIHVAGVLSSFGDGSVTSLTDSLHRLFSPTPAQMGRGYAKLPKDQRIPITPLPDIVIMSFGGFFADDDPGTLEAELAALLPGSLIFAAAGNEATCRKSFPAALPSVVAVGGLQSDGRAFFSNFGSWVDACAPCIDVVSTFFHGFDERLTVTTPDGTTKDVVTRRFEDWASWSGTSFAAPKVASLVAQELYLHGERGVRGRPDETARQVWERMSSYDHLRVPDLGIVFNA